MPFWIFFMPDKFVADMDAWAKQTTARLEAVVKTAAQAMVNEIKRPTEQGGNMPVVHGYLRNSLHGSTEQMPQISNAVAQQRRERESGTATDPNTDLVITGLRLGQTLYIGFTAYYAPYQEYKRAFVRTETARWQEYVRDAAERVKRDNTS